VTPIAGEIIALLGWSASSGCRCLSGVLAEPERFGYPPFLVRFYANLRDATIAKILRDSVK